MGCQEYVLLCWINSRGEKYADHFSVEIVVWFSVVKTCMICGHEWICMMYAPGEHRFCHISFGTPTGFFPVCLPIKIFFIFVDCKCGMVGFIVLFCLVHVFLWF